jgi:hypothetical protein
MVAALPSSHFFWYRSFFHSKPPAVPLSIINEQKAEPLNMHKGVKSAAEEIYRKGKIFWGRPSGGTEIFSISEN